MKWWNIKYKKEILTKSMIALDELIIELSKGELLSEYNEDDDREYSIKIAIRELLSDLNELQRQQDKL